MAFLVVVFACSTIAQYWCHDHHDHCDHHGHDCHDQYWYHDRLSPALFRGNCRLCFTWFQPIAGLWLLSKGPLLISGPHCVSSAFQFQCKNHRFHNKSLWTKSWQSWSVLRCYTSLIWDVILHFLLIFCLLDTILPQNWHETLACHKTQLEIMVTSHFSRRETSHCPTCMSLWPIRHGSHFFGIRSLFNPDKAQLATMIIHDIFVPQYLPRFKKLSHSTIDYAALVGPIMFGICGVRHPWLLLTYTVGRLLVSRPGDFVWNFRSKEEESAVCCRFLTRTEEIKCRCFNNLEFLSLCCISPNNHIYEHHRFTPTCQTTGLACHFLENSLRAYMRDI